MGLKACGWSHFQTSNHFERLSLHLDVEAKENLPSCYVRAGGLWVLVSSAIHRSACSCH